MLCVHVVIHQASIAWPIARFFASLFRLRLGPQFCLVQLTTKFLFHIFFFGNGFSRVAACALVSIIPFTSGAFQNTNELYICTHTQYLFRVHCKKKMYVKEETYCRSRLLAFLQVVVVMFDYVAFFFLSYQRCCFPVCRSLFLPSLERFLLIKSKPYVNIFVATRVSDILLPFLYT